MRRMRWVTAVLVVGSLSFGLAACGSDDGDGAASTTTSPEEKVSTGADVVAGLTDVKAMAAAIAADDAASDADVDALYARWFDFEGSVRATDRDLYLEMEDQLAAIKGGVRDGEAGKVAAAATQLGAVIDTYVDTRGESTATTVAASGKRLPVSAELHDYRIDLGADRARPGVTTFDVHNEGTVTHELVVVKTDLDPADLPTDADGAVDEAGAGITFVDEVEDIEVDAQPTLNVDLTAGKYVLLCNLEDHYKRKMYTSFEVG